MANRLITQCIDKLEKFFGYFTKSKQRKPAIKFAFAEEFAGDTERRTASSTANVREDSNLGSTHKLPTKVEFHSRSTEWMWFIILYLVGLIFVLLLSGIIKAIFFVITKIVK